MAESYPIGISFGGTLGEGLVRGLAERLEQSLWFWFFEEIGDDPQRKEGSKKVAKARRHI